jgi:tetratricopeptide (TPR) repeat protein
MLLYDQKRYANAADEFRKELEQNPQSALAMSMLALSLTYDRRPKEALPVAKAAVGTDPERAFCHYALACVIIGPGRSFGQKLSWAERIWGRMKLYRRRLRDAKTPAMEAIRLDPRNAELLALMAAIEFDLRRPKKSLEWSEKALACRATHVRSINLRARALAKLGRRDEARQSFQGALALDPDSAVTHAQGGWTHLQLGDRKKAIAHFQESVRLNPNDASGHLGLKAARRAATKGARLTFPIVAYILVFNLVSVLKTGSRTSPDLNSLAVTCGIAAAVVTLAVVLLIHHRRRKS